MVLGGRRSRIKDPAETNCWLAGGEALDLERLNKNKIGEKAF